MTTVSFFVKFDHEVVKVRRSKAQGYDRNQGEA